MEKLLGINEVSEILNIKKSTLRSWVFKREIPCVRLGRAVRFRPEIIEKIHREGLGRDR